MSRTTDESTYLRRQPQQERGRLRVDAILNAAEYVFAEKGYKSATTNAIAARAGANIGSLYQYFPNKEAIFAAVVERYKAEYAELGREVFNEQTLHLPLPILVDRLADAVLELHARHGIPRPFFVGVGGSTGEFAATEHEVYAGLMLRGDTALQIQKPHLDAHGRQLALEIVLRTFQALVHLVDQSAEQDKSTVIAAMKRMLYAYLEAL